MMTKEQKIEWLTKASAEELIEQLTRAAQWMTSENVVQAIEGNEDYALVKAELMKRLG